MAGGLARSPLPPVPTPDPKATGCPEQQSNPRNKQTAFANPIISELGMTSQVLAVPGRFSRYKKAQAQLCARRRQLRANRRRLHAD